MPTSAPGSSAGLRSPPRRRAGAAGFTVVELLIVIAIVAVAAGMITAALPDRQQLRLEEEGARLAALLETARVESRVTGVPVRWMPANALREGTGAAAAESPDFVFVGLSAQRTLPTRWLDRDTRAEVEGRPVVMLGPEPMLAPQRVRLALGPHRVVVASDGLGPFTVAGDDAAAAAPAR